MTPDTLHRFILPDQALHPAYENLSLVHRADYLRAYFMHHHGGGYSDVKAAYHDWSPAFATLTDPASDHWVTGYPEPNFQAVAFLQGRLGRDLRAQSRRLPGCGAFIMRPRTRLTAEWLAEVERRLDYHSERLARHPGNIWGDNAGYPIFWTEILSEILQPLFLKYLAHVRLDPRLLPDLHTHR